MMSILEKKLVRYPLYALFFCIVFALAVMASFPDDELRDVAVVKLQEQVGSKYEVKIGDIDLWWRFGATFQRISISERVDENAPPPAEGLPPILPMKVVIPSVGVRIAPIQSLLSLAPAIAYVIDVGGGDISGYATLGSKPTVYADFDDIDLRKTTALTAYLGIPFFGELDGDAEFEFDSKGKLVGGKVDLIGDKVTVGPATVKTDKFPPITYLEVPQTNFGKMKVAMDVKNKVFSLTDVGISGRDLRLEAWGHMSLASRMGSSKPKVNMRLQLDDGFVKKNSLTALTNVAQFRKGKNKDWFGFTIYGRLNKIQFKGSPQAALGVEASPVKLPGEKASDKKDAKGKDSKGDKAAKSKKPSKAKKTEKK